MHEDKINGIAFAAGSWPLQPDRSTIVFIHGSGQSRLLWQYQIKELADRVNTVAIDLPGHGQSDGDGMRTVSEYTFAVKRFVQELPVPGAIPCGLSIGGAIAQQLLIDFPEICRAGMLVCTGARLRVHPVILETIQKDYDAFVASVGDMGVSKKTARDSVQPLIADGGKCPAEVTLGDFLACDAFDAMEQLPSITLPVLVVTAEEDQLTPKKYGDYLHEAILNSRRGHILDAGHLAPWEQPLSFNSAVRDFLDAENL